MFVVLRETAAAYEGVILFFNDTWKDRFHLLQIDQRISAIGKVREVQSSDVHLERCELV